MFDDAPAPGMPGSGPMNQAGAPRRQPLPVALGVMVVLWAATLVCLAAAARAYFGGDWGTSSTPRNVAGSALVILAGVLTLASGVVPYRMSRRSWLLLGPVGFFAAYALIVATINLVSE